MLLNELIDNFIADYKFECLKRNLTQVEFPQKYLASMLAKTVSNLQKRFGIIEASTTIDSVAGTNLYNVSSSLLTPQKVTYAKYELEKTSAGWIESQYPQSARPTKYAIQIKSSMSQLYLFPTPISNGDSIIITSKMDFKLFSPSVNTIQDFGTFNGSVFTGNTVFPTQYDQAILLGMISQIFKDLIPEYEQECSLLRVRQFNGEKFSYKMD